MLPVVPKSVHKFKSPYLPAGPFDYTAFTVGQESILLAVKDSEKQEEKAAAIRQIIKECIVSPKDYDVDSIPLFVLELIFLRLREKSIGEIMEFNYVCKHTGPEEGAVSCNTALDVKIDLSGAKLKEYDGHSKKVMITDTIGIMFRYPDFDSAAVEPGTETETLLRCVDFVFDGDKLTYAKDMPGTILKDWYEALELKVKMNIYNTFLATCPHIYFEQELTCHKCGTKHKIQFTELADFFT